MATWFDDARCGMFVHWGVPAQALDPYATVVAIDFTTFA